MPGSRTTRPEYIQDALGLGLRRAKPSRPALCSLRTSTCASPASPRRHGEAAQFGVDLVEGVIGQRITGNLATLPFRGGAELVAFLGRKTGISPWVIGGIVVAGAALVLTSPQRRQAIGKYVVPVAEALVKEMERSAAP
jgi:hypothetical protein